ncbi:DMT family transporter [Candidatus Woesearchaeota archaeon]|nr:DMT family transporter [Candidatus Woesearchaeota archaeon]
MEWFLFAILSAVFFGSRQVVSKKVLIFEHATEYLTATCLMTFVFTLFFLPKMSFSYGLDIWVLMYVKCVFLTIGWLLGSKALRHLEISYVTPLTNLTPLFLLVWGFFFLGETPSVLQYSGVGLLVFGAYWLQADHHFSSLIHPLRMFKNKYSVFMIFAIFFYSLCAALDKIVLAKVNPYTYLSFTFFILSVHYLLIQFFKYDGIKDIRHAFSKGKHLIIIISLLIMFSDILYYLAVSIPGAMISLIIPVKRMSTLVATIIGGRLFHDHDMGWRLFACAIMVVGVVLIVL